MKHILEYKNYINIDELREDLRFMFIYLKDENYQLAIWVFKEESIDLEIEKKDKSYFEFSNDLINYIIRANKFLGNKGFYNLEGVYISGSETKFILRLRDEQLVNSDHVVLNSSSGVKTNKIKIKFKYRKLNTQMNQEFSH